MILKRMEAEANNFERRLQEVGQDKGPRFDGAVLDIASRAKLSKFGAQLKKRLQQKTTNGAIRSSGRSSNVVLNSTRFLITVPYPNKMVLMVVFQGHLNPGV